MAPAIASHFIAYVQPAEKEVKGPTANCPRTGSTFTARKSQALPNSAQRGRFSSFEAIDYYTVQPITLRRLPTLVMK